MASQSYRPVVLWHGMGDSCCDARSMGKVKQHIESVLPGTFVYSIRVAEDDVRASYFGRVNDQVEDVCRMLSQQPELAGGFNAIGFSQGGQFLRAYVERCNQPPVHRLVTFGSQHAGVADIPNCGDRQDPWCRMMRFAVRRGVLLPAVRDSVVQAQYFKDPSDLEGYLRYNAFLADVNNERAVKNASYANRLQSLDKFVMVMFQNDTMVFPKESSWFWYVDATKKTLIPLERQPLYQEDWIGLQAMHRAGQLVFLGLEGDHMRIPLDYLTNQVLLPYLSDPIEP